MRIKKSTESIAQKKTKWKKSDFKKRMSNDPKRAKQYSLDKLFIQKFVKKGKLCDVGCSTGEFIRSLNWDGECYGMETNNFAKKIASDIISFKKNIYTEKNFFDLVIFRGTIQHVDKPLYMIQKAYESLKKGGYIVFLATPNANSVVYRLHQDFAFLNPKTNFYIPGIKDLSNILLNNGFKIKNCELPYLNTPYANPLKDHLFFILNLFSKRFSKYAFWGNLINISAKK
jgi:SAM-dependent methyltransferase